jgi:hypothetical protein
MGLRDEARGFSSLAHTPQSVRVIVGGEETRGMLLPSSPITKKPFCHSQHRILLPTPRTRCTPAVARRPASPPTDTMACCSHDHDCEAADCGPAYSLYKHIDQGHVSCGQPCAARGQAGAASLCTPPAVAGRRTSAVCGCPHPPACLAPHTPHTTHQIRCLNEDVEGSCRNVFKPWGVRSQPTPQPLRSDADDPELLLHIPYEGSGISLAHRRASLVNLARHTPTHQQQHNRHTARPLHCPAPPRFDGAVKLKAICIIGGSGGTAPNKMRA